MHNNPDGLLFHSRTSSVAVCAGASHTAFRQKRNRIRDFFSPRHKRSGMEIHMLKIADNPTLAGLSSFFPSIVFSTATGTDLTLDLLLPQTVEGDTASRFPLIIFIEGSAWHFPENNWEIPQLSRLSCSGYAVALVTHRNIDDGHPAPAYLMDVKTAVRFMRAHAEEYHVDPDRVYAFGTSSGANAALLLGLTGDMEEFRTEEYSGFSDSVCGVIDCFGPTDLQAFLDWPGEEGSLDKQETFRAFCGGQLDPALLQKCSPVHYVTQGRDYVPFLIAHGDADPLVPFSQSEHLVSLLEQAGAEVGFICVENGVHEGNFWSQPLYDIFLAFLDRLSGIRRG